MKKDFNYYYYLNEIRSLSDFIYGDKEYDDYKDVLSMIPKEYWEDKDFCLEACKKDLLDSFSKELWEDEEFCFEVCKRNGLALKYVPDKFKGYELYYEAVKNTPQALRYIPMESRVRGLCLEAIKGDGFYIHDVPNELRTPELYYEAVKQNGAALYYVPEDLKTYDMCLVAVKSNGTALHCVPENYKDYNMCFEAVKSNISAINYLPENLKESDFGTDIMKAAYENSLDTFKENHPQYFMGTLEKLKDNHLLLNNIIENLSDKDLQDEAIRNALVERFSDYEISECYNLDNLKKYPDKLLDIIKNTDFDDADLGKNIELINKKNENDSNIRITKINHFSKDDINRLYFRCENILTKDEFTYYLDLNTQKRFFQKTGASSTFVRLNDLIDVEATALGVSNINEIIKKYSKDDICK